MSWNARVERTAKHEKRRQQIIDAAKKLFFEHQYEDVSIADLEKESGLTRGPIYYYFRNKEEIYAGVIVDGLKMLEQHIHSLPQEPVAFFKHLVHYFSKLYSDDKALFDLQFRFFFQRFGAVSLSEEHQAEIMKTVSNIADTFVNIINDGCKSGLFACDNPKFASLSIWGMLVTTLQMDRENSRFKEFDLAREALQDMLEQQILRMLAPDKNTPTCSVFADDGAACDNA